MIKFMTPYGSELREIEEEETPHSFAQKLMVEWKRNFTYILQEALTGRVIPDDEILISGREYYMSFGIVS